MEVNSDHQEWPFYNVIRINNSILFALYVFKWT